ncbi:phospholipase D-like domain-containing protein [Brevibacillus sp. GCM10020057]|uniref:phospholipase D-like domain-containing protein n=1 Tax=Brevibacillus sp. GCM10020057 TaxID=3317327 RepID=UPI00363FC7B3
MAKEVISFGKIELITTRGELGYQEVIDDFPNAKFIFVATYNISEKRDELNNLLQKYSTTADIRVVTNIPSRFDKYYDPKEKPKFGKTPREKARDSIENYTEKLNPEKYEGLKTFFHFQNHSKIVLTDNIAYIGSANYSPESRDSRETGVLFKDPEMVKAIIDVLVPLIEGEGIQYFGDNKINELKIVFSLLLTQLNRAMDTLHEEMFNYGGYIDEFEFYNANDPGLSKQSMSGLLDVLSDIEGEVESLKSEGLEKLSRLIDDDIIESMRELLEDERPMDNVAQFNRSGFVDTTLAERMNQRMYDSEELEDLMEVLQSEAFEHHRELAEEAEDDVRELFSLAERLKEKLVEIIDGLAQLDAEQSRIDNTK